MAEILVEIEPSLLLWKLKGIANSFASKVCVQVLVSGGRSERNFGCGSLGYFTPHTPFG